MDFKFVISVLLAIPASPYEFSCFYEWCTLSNIDLTIDGLYPFTIIPNDTDTLILKGATGKRLNLTLLQNTPLLTLIVLANSKLEDIVVHQLKTPSSLVLRHVSLKQIHFHPSDNTLEHIRLCGVPFSVIPQSVLQLQHLVELEQCRSPLRNLRLSDLRNLHSLVNLNLSYNKIRTVTADTFGDCCGKLKSLNLIGNALVRFNFGVLNYLQELESLFLGHNHIATVHTLVPDNYSTRNRFCSWKNYYLARIERNITIPEPACSDYFAKLNTITLNNNRLTKIEMSTFEHMNVLTDLDLAYNNITSIKLANGRQPIALNISLLKGSAGYLHNLPPDVFSEL